MTTNTAVNTPGSSYMLYTQQQQQHHQQQQQHSNNRNQISRIPTSTSGGQQQWRNTDDIYGFRSNNPTGIKKF